MKKLLIISGMIALLAACSHTHPAVDNPDEQGQTNAQTFAADGDNTIEGGVTSPVSSATVYYFDFDKEVLKPEAQDALKDHAAYLATHPAAVVRIEGHTDERGSRDYNVALGERRAQAVSHFLEQAGVDSAHIVIVSYGEEKPAALGQTEDVYRQNRRAVLVYESQG